ncbi:acyl-CoA dehydrogenase family protein [Corynebacterium otitidis]|uniref:acyl-CoA dehydrogenase family protein n=1 Tax=Corynebacterium otitidis TaxID=29321 RepID=UPI001ED9B94D|nr:acyl-CoA dehydrogenase family protein [Corynebacterium otitidis]
MTKRRGSWFRSPAERYRNDPFVLRLVGELDARNAAVAALAERLAARFDEVVALGSGVTAEARGEFAVAVARLKVASSEAATDLAHRVFEATGSSSTASSHGLDRYWRNIRTHSLHDPVDYKKLEVGDFYLNGTPPPPTLYT